MTAPTIALDDTPPHPGLRHALLAALAEAVHGAHRTGLRAILPEACSGDDVHARQHVTAEGCREENGILWLERVALPFTRASGPLARLVHPAAGEEQRLTSRWTEERAELFDDAGMLTASARIDAYRRVLLEPAPAAPSWLRLPAACAPPGGSRRALRVAIIGDAHRMRHVYPAVLAALGDTSDALGRNIEIEIAATVDDLTARGVDGIVLPGGADMGQVEPLVAACRRARSRDLPMLGLCLGMQAMALEAVRALPGLQDAALAEVAPEAEVKLFTRLIDAEETPVSRLGDRLVCLDDSSRIAESLAACGMPTRWVERMNHRFRFEPRYRAALSTGGLDVAALDSAAGVVDVIEDKRRRFYAGASGHPELTSRPDRPHPLFVAFVRAAASTG